MDFTYVDEEEEGMLRTTHATHTEYMNIPRHYHMSRNRPVRHNYNKDTRNTNEPATTTVQTSNKGTVPIPAVAFINP